MYVSKMGKAKEVFYTEAETPKADGVNVLMQMKASAICGTDKHMYMDGSYEGRVWGHEFAGVVIDPGSRKDLVPGDKVCVFPNEPCGECELCMNGKQNICLNMFRGAGGHSGSAEYQLLDPHQVVKMADNMSYVEGALVEPATVCYHALSRAHIPAGGSLLITGVGGLTGILCSVARAMGVKTIVAIDGSLRRAQPLLDKGVLDAFVNSEEPGAFTKLMEAAQNPLGYDAMIDVKGGADVFAESFPCVKNGGIAVMVAEFMDPKDAVNIYDIVEDEKTVTGAYAYTKAEYEEVCRLIGSGVLDVAWFVGKTFKLSEGKEAFEYAFDRDALPSKIIMVP